MTIDKYMDEIIDFGYNVQGYKEKKMTFCKYEFLSPTEWATYKAQITDDVQCAIVEIGNICLAHDEEGNCTDLSPLYAVDILWNGEPLESFSTKEVFPNPCGIHVFSGCEEMYLKRFCQFNPDSPYCVIPTPDATL